MFKVVFDGVPALNLIPLDDMDRNTLYLSSDHSSVIMQDDFDCRVVFDLQNHTIHVYERYSSTEIKENHPGTVMLLPRDNATVALNIQIMWGTK